MSAPDEEPPGGTRPRPALGSLIIDPSSASIVAGQSLRLHTRALDASGAELPAAGTPQFRSSDPARVVVDGTGLVGGIAPAAAVITASLTVGEITRTAESRVTVVPAAPPPPPASAVVTTPDKRFRPSFVVVAAGGAVTWTSTDNRHSVTFLGAEPPGGSIAEIAEGESASRTFPMPGSYVYRCTRHGDEGTVEVRVPVETGSFASLSLTPPTLALAPGDSAVLTATGLDEQGNPVRGLPLPAFSSSDPAVATVSPLGVARGIGEGSATITASLTVASTTRTANAAVRVASAGAPTRVVVNTPGVTFSPASVSVAAGGTVTWQITGTRHNVTFPGAAPPGGNIPDTDEGNAVSRTFTTAGTYDYVCTRHSGMSGTVVVR